MSTIPLKTRILFIVTSDQNMGDLSNCLEWADELGRDEFSFFFVLSSALEKFITAPDAAMAYSPTAHVHATIRESIRRVAPHLVILASNTFWNIPGQAGAEWGYFDAELLEYGIPILSFDPLEGCCEIEVELSQTRTVFGATPPGVHALRGSPNAEPTGGILHYRIEGRFRPVDEQTRGEVLLSVGAAPGRQHVLLPFSRQRYDVIRKIYSDYFRHLARLLATHPADGVEFIILTPERIAEFEGMGNVLQVEHLPFFKFRALLKASDLFLTDSFISGGLLAAISGCIPSILLANSFTSPGQLPEPLRAESGKLRNRPGFRNITQALAALLAAAHSRFLPRHAAPRWLTRRSFIHDGLIPFQVFPYGMVRLSEYLERRYRGEGCYERVEILDVQVFAKTLAELLSDTPRRRNILERCRQFQSSFAGLMTPREVVRHLLPQAAISAVPASQENS